MKSNFCTSHTANSGAPVALGDDTDTLIVATINPLTAKPA